MGYTEKSLIGICTDILGKVDKYQPLPSVINDAAVALFRTKTTCDSLCLEIRMALIDLHRHGEFRFKDED